MKTKDTNTCDLLLAQREGAPRCAWANRVAFPCEMGDSWGMATKPDRPRHSEKVIAALLTSRTQGEAAETLGVSVRSLQRWQRHEGFQKEFARAKQTMLAQTLAKLQADSAGAAHVLAELARDNDSPPAVRASSAARLLELTFRGVEFSELDARLRKLEGGLNEL